MPKYKIYATVTQRLECVIDADNYESAQRIEENELEMDDFTVVNSAYQFDNLVELESKDYCDDCGQVAWLCICEGDK